MLAGIARGLRFTRVERDRLFSAAGYDARHDDADGNLGNAHVEPGLMRVLDRLADTPALAMDPLARVLHQTPPATALFGDLTYFTGWARSSYYRWFTHTAERRYFTVGEQSAIGIEIVADLRRRLERGKTDCAAGNLIRILLNRSSEFADIWRSPSSASCLLVTRGCRIVHPELGIIDLHREVLSDRSSGQTLVIYLAMPGSESHDKLKLASVIGHQRF